MKLLLDENLWRKLVARLADLYPGSRHVAEVNLGACGDRVIWNYAGENGFVIVTAESDFHELAASKGAPPKGRLAAKMGAAHR